MGIPNPWVEGQSCPANPAAELWVLAYLSFKGLSTPFAKLQEVSFLPKQNFDLSMAGPEGEPYSSSYSDLHMVGLQDQLIFASCPPSWGKGSCMGAGNFTCPLTTSAIRKWFLTSNWNPSAVNMQPLVLVLPFWVIQNMPASPSMEHIHLYGFPWNCEVLKDEDGAWFLWSPQNLAQWLIYKCSMSAGWINGCARDKTMECMPDELCYPNVKTVFVSTIHILELRIIFSSHDYSMWVKNSQK